MTDRICNWCAKVEPEEQGTLWIRATLRIEGLVDGSISWLPERVLDFCAAEDCTEQVGRVQASLLEAHVVDQGILVRLTLRSTGGSQADSAVSFPMERRFDAVDGAEDVRALARFFHETSHPKLRRKLEEFAERS